MNVPAAFLVSILGLIMQVKYKFNGEATGCLDRSNYYRPFYKGIIGFVCFFTK